MSLRKVLVANRGEIAVRAFRAAYELGASTVAVYPYEDRHAVHRAKADEAYQIGELGRPVRAYLDVDAIVDVAESTGADAIYPGYGFLAENAALARSCARVGITFVGPSAEVLELTGDKSRSVAAARDAGVPVLSSSSPSDDVDTLVESASTLGFPLFVKAVAGGGGRGMRRVEEPGPDFAALREAIRAASREAEAAFGDGRVFLEQAVTDPRHIEVQILADHTGQVIHLFERDCSLQRRHQKVIEIAPAPALDPKLREQICADAVSFARHIGYTCAGTVEFLVDREGRHVFIEMNPRIQVEHTVTEEITDVDLVSSQLRLAAGETLADLGLTQESVTVRGTALQCRITTEDPSADFRPDTGRITVYRSPGGSGIRLDGAAHLGAEISGHFDSMLVKLTCRGADHQTAVRRARRALAEFRIRGVSTNLGFLRAVLGDPDFVSGRVTTSFIADRTHLLTGNSSTNRTGRLLDYLADVTVNRPHGMRPTEVYPRDKLPVLQPDARHAHAPAAGRQELLRVGPAEFARLLRELPQVAVTDTTFRDAHQSLLATRVRTSGLEAVAGHVARLTPHLWSLECWGGATFDVALRFLAEDPWERVERLREEVPNIPLQMLLRGRNTVGYTPYPETVTRAFVDEAARTGIDVFRIFDALNDVEAMRPAVEAVLETGTTVAEVAMAYTGDLSDPAERLYTLDHWLRLADQIVASGAHVLAIKDMAGLLRPPAATTLVTALRREFDIPIHVHTHDTAGGQLATYLAAVAAGADAVDGASAPMAGTTSQPALSAIVAAFAHTDRDTGLDLDAVLSLEPYWEALRAVYRPFESAPPGPTGRIYTHEIPGGQLSNLRAQAMELGLAGRFEDVEAAYAGANRILGRPVKVTPSSKVVGDLALAMVGAGVTAEEMEADPTRLDVPGSVVEFLRGELGTPAGGWPAKLRSAILSDRGVEPLDGPPALDPVSREDSLDLAVSGATGREALNRLLFPGPAAEFAEHRRRFGDTSRLSANQFFYGLRQGEEQRVSLDEGVEVLIRLEAIGEPDAKGLRTVYLTVNGQPRTVTVRDRAAKSTGPVAQKADEAEPGQVGAPFSGVVSLRVGVGDSVRAGDQVGTIEAMKMEAPITAHATGVVRRLLIQGPRQVEAGDLLLVVDQS
ncbi:pyruvate carboxylase [Dietzia sp. SLG510A3-30A2]|nr:pyruvate carboxylase [Dietzia sp. SLG510A3-30A2]